MSHARSGVLLGPHVTVFGELFSFDLEPNGFRIHQQTVEIEQECLDTAAAGVRRSLEGG